MAVRGSKKGTKTENELDANALLAAANASPALAGPLAADNPLLFSNAAVLEFATAQLTEEVLRATNLRFYVLRKLGNTAFLVDHYRIKEITEMLTKKGYEPRLAG